MEPVARLRGRRPVPVGVGDGRLGGLAPGLGPPEDVPRYVRTEARLSRPPVAPPPSEAQSPPSRRRPEPGTVVGGGETQRRLERPAHRLGRTEPRLVSHRLDGTGARGQECLGGLQAYGRETPVSPRNGRLRCGTETLPSRASVAGVWAPPGSTLTAAMAARARPPWCGCRPSPCAALPGRAPGRPWPWRPSPRLRAARPRLPLDALEMARVTAVGVHYARARSLPPSGRARAANAGPLGDLQGITGKVCPPRSPGADCKMYPDHDHRDPVAVVHDLITAIAPGADCGAVGEALRPTAPDRPHYRQRGVWALEENPRLLTGDVPLQLHHVRAAALIARCTVFTSASTSPDGTVTGDPDLPGHRGTHPPKRKLLFHHEQLPAAPCPTSDLRVPPKPSSAIWRRVSFVACGKRSQSPVLRLLRRSSTGGSVSMG